MCLQSSPQRTAHHRAHRLLHRTVGSTRDPVMKGVLVYFSCAVLTAHIIIVQPFHVSLTHSQHNWQQRHDHVPQSGQRRPPQRHNHLDNNNGKLARLRARCSTQHWRYCTALGAGNGADLGEVKRALSATQERLEMNRSMLDEAKLGGELEYLEAMSGEDGFWNDADNARKVLGNLSRCAVRSVSLYQCMARFMRG